MSYSLYFARIRSGLTQQELAKQAGISRRTVCALEKGDRFPSFKVAMRLCSVLGCEPKEVFPLEIFLP